MNQATKRIMAQENIHETDWETVFESPVHGFITLVEQAQTVKSLKQCTSLIISNLFTRENDAPFLAAYHEALDGFLPTNESEDVDVSYSKKRVVALLRDIKKHRQRKSAEHAAQAMMAVNTSEKSNVKSNTETSELTENRTSKNPPTMPGLTSPATEEPATDKESESFDDVLQIFADIFCNALGERLKALYQPTDQNRKENDKLPFILSEDFSRHFDEIVRHRIVPAILESSRGLTKMVREQPEDERREFLTKYLDSRNGRQVLWEKWQDTWKELTQQQPLPPKPKGKPKKSLMSAFSLKKEKKVPAWKREKTPEEWEAAAKQIKIKNKAAAAIWSEISTDTGNWLPPQESDNKLLMDMFARSIQGLQKQNSGLCQIVQQGDSVARLLTNFAKGKDIDLALLAACYQNPDLFYLKKNALKEMMMSYSQKEVDEDFAMVSRYLSKHF